MRERRSQIVPRATRDDRPGEIITDSAITG
jgi:hypothetical protein